MEIIKAEIADAGKILEIQKIAYLSEARRYDDYEIPPLVKHWTKLNKNLLLTYF